MATNKPLGENLEILDAPLQQAPHLLQDPLRVFQVLVQAYQETRAVEAHEATRRRQIAAWEKSRISALEMHKQVLLTCLDRSFDERAENFRRFFALADEALESGNNAALQSVLVALTELAKSSPFKDIADLASAQAGLEDTEHIWEI